MRNSILLQIRTLSCLAVGMAVFTPDAKAASEDVHIGEAFRYSVPNIPGKTLTAVVVDYAPGAKSPSHRHASSAFIIGYVLSGAIRSQLNGGKTEVFQAGQTWTEVPGTHHTISENASETEPAKLLAIFLVDDGDAKLTTDDPK